MRMRATIKEEPWYRVRDYIRKPEDHIFPVPPTPWVTLTYLVSRLLSECLLFYFKKIRINVHLWDRNMDCAKTNIKLLVER